MPSNDDDKRRSQRVRWLDEALRRLGSDVLDEEIPEHLRRIVRPGRGGEDEQARSGGADHGRRERRHRNG